MVMILLDFHYGHNTCNRIKVNLRETNIEENDCNRSREG